MWPTGVTLEYVPDSCLSTVMLYAESSAVASEAIYVRDQFSVQSTGKKIWGCEPTLYNGTPISLCIAG